MFMVVLVNLKRVFLPDGFSASQRTDDRAALTLYDRDKPRSKTMTCYTFQRQLTQLMQFISRRKSPLCKLSRTFWSNSWNLT